MTVRSDESNWFSIKTLFVMQLFLEQNSISPIFRSTNFLLYDKFGFYHQVNLFNSLSICNNCCSPSKLDFYLHLLEFFLSFFNFYFSSLFYTKKLTNHLDKLTRFDLMWILFCVSTQTKYFLLSIFLNVVSHCTIFVWL